MSLSGKRVLILLGGQWHDFAGFASVMQPLLESHGLQVETTYDLDMLLHLAETSMTCIELHLPHLRWRRLRNPARIVHPAPD
jgi:hypothetical protein